MLKSTYKNFLNLVRLQQIYSNYSNLLACSVHLLVAQTGKTILFLLNVILQEQAVILKTMSR